MPEMFEGHVPSVKKDYLFPDGNTDSQIKEHQEKERFDDCDLTDKEGIAFNVGLAREMIKKAMGKELQDDEETLKEMIQEAEEYFFDNHCSTEEAAQVISEMYPTGSRYKEGDKKDE